MTKTGGNPPVSALEKADYPMNMAFPSQCRLGFTPSPLFAVAYSVFPYIFLSAQASRDCHYLQSFRCVRGGRK